MIKKIDIISGCLIGQTLWLQSAVGRRAENGNKGAGEKGERNEGIAQKQRHAEKGKLHVGDHELGKERKKGRVQAHMMNGKAGEKLKNRNK